MGFIDDETSSKICKIDSTFTNQSVRLQQLNVNSNNSNVSIDEGNPTSKKVLDASVDEEKMFKARKVPLSSNPEIYSIGDDVTINDENSAPPPPHENKMKKFFPNFSTTLRFRGKNRNDHSGHVMQRPVSYNNFLNQLNSCGVSPKLQQRRMSCHDLMSTIFPANTHTSSRQTHKSSRQSIESIDNLSEENMFDEDSSKNDEVVSVELEKEEVNEEEKSMESLEVQDGRITEAEDDKSDLSSSPASYQTCKSFDDDKSLEEEKSFEEDKSLVEEKVLEEEKSFEEDRSLEEEKSLEDENLEFQGLQETDKKSEVENSKGQLQVVAESVEAFDEVPRPLTPSLEEKVKEPASKEPSPVKAESKSPEKSRSFVRGSPQRKSTRPSSNTSTETFKMLVASRTNTLRVKKRLNLESGVNSTWSARNADKRPTAKDLFDTRGKPQTKSSNQSSLTQCYALFPASKSKLLKRRSSVFVAKPKNRDSQSAVSRLLGNSKQKSPPKVLSFAPKTSNYSFHSRSSSVDLTGSSYSFKNSKPKFPTLTRRSSKSRMASSPSKYQNPNDDQKRRYSVSCDVTSKNYDSEVQKTCGMLDDVLKDFDEENEEEVEESTVSVI